MNIHKALTVSAIAVALATPGFASATALWHETSGEGRSVFYPDHLKSTKTRADVQQELEGAIKDGSLWFLHRGLPVPGRNAGPRRTREEVRKEVLSLTDEERQQYQMIGGR